MKTEIIVHHSLSSIPDNPWKNRTEWLEYDLAVKWIALEATFYSSARVVFIDRFGIRWGIMTETTER